MQLEGKNIGEILMVKSLGKRIDASSAAEFKGKMVDWINSGHYRIALDLSEVDFIDSSGLGAIVSSLKTIGDRGDMVLFGLRDSVMSLFRLTRLTRVFQIFPSEEEAFKALTG